MAIKKWVKSRKLEIVTAIKNGTLPRSHACSMWNLSDDELQQWIDAIDAKDQYALKIKKSKKMRQRLEKINRNPS